MAFARFWKRLPSFNAATDELSAQKHLGKGTNATHKLPYFTFSHEQYGVPCFSWGLSSFVPSLPFFLLFFFLTLSQMIYAATIIG